MSILTTEEFEKFLNDLIHKQEIFPRLFTWGPGKFHGKIVDVFAKAVERIVESGPELYGTLTLEDIEVPEELREEWGPVYEFPYGEFPLSKDFWELWKDSPGFIFNFDPKNKLVTIWVYLPIGHRFIKPMFPYEITDSDIPWFRIPFEALSPEHRDGFVEMWQKTLERKSLKGNYYDTDNIFCEEDNDNKWAGDKDEY